MTCHLGQLAEDAAGRGGTLVFEGASYDTGEGHARAVRLAGGLASAGVLPGDRVVVLMANCPEVAIAYDAIWRAGAVVAPVVFLLTAAELAHVLTDSGAVAVLTTAEFVAKVTQTGVAIPTYVVGEALWSALEQGAESALVPRADDELAALLYTGGTTGRAKGVMLTHANLWQAGKAAHDNSYEPGLTGSLTALPLSHAYGLIVTVVGMHSPEPILAVLQRWFDPAAFLALAAEHRVTRMAVVPSMLQLLLAQPVESFDLSALRYITSGGSPLASSVLVEWERRVPGAQVQEGYGLTESSAIVSGSSNGRRAGSVGRPLPGVEVRILDPAGAGVGTGVDGEICVRSAGVTPGYWHAEEATAYTLRDGWLHTGDIGHLDEDGYLFVVDRLKDLIIRGGFNVYPRDVEDVLLGHPAVASAAVVGRPDPMHGEEVVAFVALRAGADATAEQLIAYARGQISAAKYPREVHLVPAIPLTSVGKTDRKALREGRGQWPRATQSSYEPASAPIVVSSP